MKNWIIILLLFALPLGTYAYLDAKSQNAKTCSVEALNKMQDEMANSKVKIIKFSSPMCSECKKMAQELNKAMESLKDSVILEEINISETTGKNAKYNKSAIKKYNVTLVPTVVFIDKEGNAIQKKEGLLKSDEIIEIVNGIE